MGNEATQVLKFVIISFRAFRYSFVQIQTLSLFTELDFMRSHSQQFLEDSEIS